MRLSALRDRLHVVVPGLLLAVSACVRVIDPMAAQQARHWVFDSYNRLKPRPYEDVPVRIVDIDDESIARLGQWPWPRTLVARVVRRLNEHGAAAVALDIVFSEPDRTSPRQVIPVWTGDRREGMAELASRFADHDELFAKTIGGSRVVAGSALLPKANGRAPAVKASFATAGHSPLPFLFSFKGAVTNLPPIEKAAKGVGSFNIIPERDGIIRRVPLLFRLGDTIVPSLAAEALRVAQGASTIYIKASGASGEASFGAQSGINQVKIGDLVSPTDAFGRIWVYYTGPAPRRTIPVWKVLEKDFDPAAVAGTIVFLGTSAAGLMDQRHTPIEALAPGVEVHAQLAEQVLLQRFLLRPDWADGAEVAFLVLFGALVVLLMRRLGAAAGAAAALGAAGFAIGFSWWAFTRWSFLMDPLYPAGIVLLIYLCSSLFNFLRTEREKAAVRGAFGRYMSPVLVEKLAAHPELLELGGEARTMTFHFCDIEGFTTMSQWQDPRALVRLLNRFLTPMTDIILRHKGSIDKYVGDCIVAYWNAPLDDPDHAKNACLAVLEMHKALKRLNAEWKAQAEREGVPHREIRIRTGLNTGSCIVGNMGSQQRFDYSIIGDDVNVASRLEGANKFFGTYVLVGEATMAAARGAIAARELGQVTVVGKEAPIRVFEPLAPEGELSAEWARALPHHVEGLKKFHGRDFEGALLCFNEVLKVFPDDGPAKLYRDLATDYSHIPPPDDWAMVFKLTAK